MLHYEETLVYLFTGEVTNVTQITFKGIQYEVWFKHLRDSFPSIIINTTPEGFHFLNQVKDWF